ncbi:MAG: ABC transporter ATP-binding protein [Phycisphaeraceae bacterium]
MASPDAIISVDQLRFGYDATPVLAEVSATLRPGKVTALVGPNASGKSTLMRLMLGLLQPWSGSVDMGGQSIASLTSADRAKRVSYVPQRPGVRFAFTVRQVIAMGANGLSRRDAARTVDHAIEQAGLSSLADRVLMELSGGQQQRVLLARAEVQSASSGQAMLLDEPGSNLDLKHRHEMMQRLRQLAQDGLAVLVVLHELDLAVRYADEAWLMDAGRLVAAGPWDTVLTPTILNPVYDLELEQIDRGDDRPLLVVCNDFSDTMMSDSLASRTTDQGAVL